MYYTIGTPDNEHPTLRSLVEKGVPIFNDWWETYIPEHKKELETKIIRHYYFERIGVETPDQFIWRINEHLARIMPYYNQLYASELIKFNPLLNHSIASSGRSIQNMVSKANTSDDKYAKSIRDFVGLTDRDGTESRSGKVLETGGSTTTEHAGYGKSGNENVKNTENVTGKSEEISHSTEKTDGMVDKTENVTGQVNTIKNSTTIGTETPGVTTTKKMNWGQTETGKETLSGTEVTDKTKNDHWTETIDDDSTTKVVTDLDETTTGSGDKGYSDTPQKELTGGVEKIRKDYLTNYTWTDENSQHKADTTTDTTYADDQTKEHTGDEKGKDSTTKSGTTDTSKSKGGTDTETTEKTGADKTNTTVNGSETENSSKDTVGKEITDETVTTDGSKNVSTGEDTTGNVDKKWSEGGSEDKSTTVDKNLSTDSTGQVSTSGTEQSRENSDVTQTSVGNQTKDTQETTDKGTSDTTEGFMNVSASALIEAFRRTFLNIDEMIVNDLRDNFMVVY